MTRQFTQLEYDIPVIEVRSARTGRIHKEGVVPNPSGILRRIGARTTGSVWIIPEDLFPWKLIARWEKHNEESPFHKISWWTLPLSNTADGLRQIVIRATAALERELEEAQTRCLDSISSATKRLEKSDKGDAHEKFARDIAAVTARANKAIRDARAAAEVFGVDGLPIDETQQMLNMMSSNARQCAVLYGAMATRVMGTMLESAAENSEVPPGILADFIEDMTGEDMSHVHDTFARGR